MLFICKRKIEFWCIFKFGMVKYLVNCYYHFLGRVAYISKILNRFSELMFIYWFASAQL